MLALQGKAVTGEVKRPGPAKPKGGWSKSMGGSGASRLSNANLKELFFIRTDGRMERQTFINIQRHEKKKSKELG